MNHKKFLSLILTSVLLSIFSLSITFLVSAIGVSVSDNAGHTIQKREIDEKRVYSQQEFDEMNRIAMEQIQRKINQLDNSEDQGLGLFIEKVRSVSIYYSWIPWFIFALLFSTTLIGKLKEIPYLLCLPFIFLFFNVFSGIEVLVFGLSIILGASMKSIWSR